LAAWSAVAKPSIGSLVGLAFYGMAYGAARLFDAAGHFLGFAPETDPSSFGLWISLVVTGAVATMCPIEGTKDLLRQLYPREAWARSAFYPLLARSKLFALIALAAVAAVAVMVWFLDAQRIPFPVLLSFLLFYTSFPLAEAGEDGSNKSHARIVDTLAKLLEEAGYRVVRTPRTGKAEIDPLLASVDLLARAGDQAFAMQVKSITSRTPVEWNQASAVQTAALLLSDEIVNDAGTSVPVEPVLILVGGALAQSLTAFSQRERVAVVHFDTTDSATADRQEIVRRLQEAGMVFPFMPAPTVPA
jgi:hypothetical protein